MQAVYFNAILVILVFGFVVEQILDFLNSKNKETTVPEDLRNFYDQEKYTKSLNYKRAHNKVGNISGWMSFVASMLFLLLGGFNWLNELLLPEFGDTLWLSLVYFGVLFFASDIMGIPFGLYATFVIEEKFGFNKTTPTTYFIDKIKSYAMTIILGGGIMYVLLLLITSIGEQFWLYAWAVMVAIMIFTNFFYTTLFVPIFNKLTSLEDGELRTEIEKLAAKLNFPLTKIQVMNASKRTSKGNAYFAGFGKKKSIVLFDTLIEKHEVDELVGILAHEIGHYKKKHIIGNMVQGIALNGLMLWLLSWFIFNPELSMALGADQLYIHLNLIAFGILYGPISMITGLIGNVISRKNEYEADAYAIEHTKPEALKTALIRLSTDSLSDLKPHPAYVFMHYSHPTLLQRLKAINSNA
ncbi:MAG: M48 family metallopeptidase [Bacteroidetes bacterium]|nr:M48 family metallopeptidase [Bacteroidota bacterium]